MEQQLVEQLLEGTGFDQVLENKNLTTLRLWHGCEHVLKHIRRLLLHCCFDPGDALRLQPTRLLPFPNTMIMAWHILEQSLFRANRCMAFPETHGTSILPVCVRCALLYGQHT